MTGSHFRLGGNDWELFPPRMERLGSHFRWESFAPVTPELHHWRIHDVTNITLEAKDNGDAVLVQCTEDAGLAFINISNRNVVIDGCGFTA